MTVSQVGSKRKADGLEAVSPDSKRGRTELHQQTLEETMLDAEQADHGGDDHVLNDQETSAAEQAQGGQADVQPSKNRDSGKIQTVQSSSEDASAPTDSGVRLDKNGEGVEPIDHEDSTTKEEKKDKPDVDPRKQNEVSGASKRRDHGSNTGIEKTSERAKDMPSNLIEKGLIYFFTRGRVGVDEPAGVDDLQRTHFVLRPIPKEGQIVDGIVPDDSNARLIALPKKVFPKSGGDRFMAFVEKANTTVKSLKEIFFQGSSYDTKTAGERHQSAVTPVGEGVYAMTSDGRTSHLSYILTVPKELGDVQIDLGLGSQGSFVLSLKNPTAPSPAYATLPEKPEYPEDMVAEFGQRRFIPVPDAKFMNYANAQFLLIGKSGEEFPEELEKSAEDKKNDNKAPREELERLEDEDEARLNNIKGDETIFEDLGISKEEYANVLTTW